jgi:hypothetical protein
MGMAKVISVCLGLACASLLLPSEPSYDPWAWLVWGRELTALELDTTGGPSWKPLPVAFAALVAPLSGLGEGVPAALWMAVARAGALLALALAFRLAWRLAGGRPSTRLLAGITAATALALTPEWLRYVAHGSEAPLAAAFSLWAVERHLDGRRDQACILGALVSLMRPELFPLLAVYALLWWRADPSRAAVVAGLLLVVPLAWIVPEWIGSGHPLDAAAQARSEPSWSLSHAEVPWQRALVRVHNHAGLALEVLGLAAAAMAVMRRERAVLVLGAAALSVSALFVLSTEAGFSGNARYVLAGLTILCLLAGLGAARLVELGLERVGRIGAAATIAVIAPLAALHAAPRIERMGVELGEVAERTELHRDLARAVDAAGGARDVFALGPPTANRAFHTRLAWELGVPIRRVELGRGRGVVFRSSRGAIAGPVRTGGRVPAQRIATVGSWDVFTARSRRRVHVRVGAGRIDQSRVVTR